jgi:hypothetical protein
MASHRIVSGFPTFESDFNRIRAVRYLTSPTNILLKISPPSRSPSRKLTSSEARETPEHHLSPALSHASQTALLSLDNETDIHAAASQVWNHLCQARGFGMLADFTVATEFKRFAVVGDAVAASRWEDHGMLICTFVKSGEELRVTFEPDHGRYLWQTRVTLAPVEGGTRVAVLDRYSQDRLETLEEDKADRLNILLLNMQRFRDFCETR